MDLPDSAFPVIVIAALHGWLAWRSSRLPLGQDEGLWLLWGITGSRPYLDHVDCKPPGIQLWLALLARLAARRVGAIQGLHHLGIGGLSITVCQLSGDVHTALFFTLFATSGWLYGHHAWSEPLSTGWLLIALLLDPWTALPCLVAAILCNSKLAAPAALWLAVSGAWWPLAALAGLLVSGGALIRVLWPELARELWYGCVVVSRRMVAVRRRCDPWAVLSRGLPNRAALVLVVPAVGLALLSGPPSRVWLPALAYVAINALGGVWRPNHFIPLAILGAGGAPEATPILLAADWLSHGFYAGDVDRANRPGPATRMAEARKVGELLRDRPGDLWVDSTFTQIYVYARKKPVANHVEQVEIRDVIEERRRSTGLPAKARWIVYGPGSTLGLPRRYRTEYVGGPFTVIEILSRGSEPPVIHRKPPAA